MHVSPVNVKTLALVLELEGLDPTPALSRCGIDSLDALDDQGPWLSIERFGHLLTAALDLTDDPCFGLVAGKSKGLMRYAALMQVTLVAPTLRQVLADITRFAPLFLERPELELQEHGSAARVLVRPVVTEGRGGRFRTEWLATSVMHLLRFTRLTSHDIVGVDFPYPNPSPQHWARYRSTFGTHLRFEQPRCAIEFNARKLDAPLQTHDPLAYAGAKAAAESALAARRAGSDVAERVRRLLLTSLPRQPSVQQAAEHLRLTERSLRRQLAALGLNYAALARQCQQLAAQQLLADSDLSVKQVADRLGFSCVTSFHRAFRRWTDMTPVQWRRQPRAPGASIHA